MGDSSRTNHRYGDRDRDRDRGKGWDRDRERDSRKRGRSNSRDKDRGKDKSKTGERHRKRSRSKERSSDRDKSKSREKDSERYRNRDREKERDGERHRSRSKERSSDRKKRSRKDKEEESHDRNKEYDRDNHSYSIPDVRASSRHSRQDYGKSGTAEGKEDRKSVDSRRSDRSGRDHGRDKSNYSYANDYGQSGSSYNNRNTIEYNSNYSREWIQEPQQDFQNHINGRDQLTSPVRDDSRRAGSYREPKEYSDVQQVKMNQSYSRGQDNYHYNRDDNDHSKEVLINSNAPQSNRNAKEEKEKRRKAFQEEERRIKERREEEEANQLYFIDLSVMDTVKDDRKEEDSSAINPLAMKDILICKRLAGDDLYNRMRSLRYPVELSNVDEAMDILNQQESMKTHDEHSEVANDDEVQFSPVENTSDNDAIDCLLSSVAENDVSSNVASSSNELIGKEDSSEDAEAKEHTADMDCNEDEVGDSSDDYKEEEEDEDDDLYGDLDAVAAETEEALEAEKMKVDSDISHPVESTEEISADNTSDIDNLYADLSAMRETASSTTAAAEESLVGANQTEEETSTDGKGEHEITPSEYFEVLSARNPKPLHDVPYANQNLSYARMNLLAKAMEGRSFASQFSQAIPLLVKLMEQVD